MNTDQILALTVFAAVSSGTPGPNNVMILASGVNFGFKRSMPHLFGISLGFCFMIFCVGMGLQTMFVQFPILEALLRYMGAAYLLWLAWKLANSGPISQTDGAVAKPMSFLAAAAFQWVNPKAWIMIISAITTYAASAGSTSKIGQVLLVVLIFGVVNLPLVACWAAFGSGMRKFLQDPKKLRIFNITMAMLLVASLYPIVQPMIQSLFSS
jgi:threonine/homoserine/homoserine lactone efflux protein